MARRPTLRAADRRRALDLALRVNLVSGRHAHESPRSRWSSRSATPLRRLSGSHSPRSAPQESRSRENPNEEEDDPADQTDVRAAHRQRSDAEQDRRGNPHVAEPPGKRPAFDRVKGIQTDSGNEHEEAEDDRGSKADCPLRHDY